MSAGRGRSERDEHARPGKGSRPRTKVRPEHNDAVEAMVTTVDRGRYTLLLGADTAEARPLTAMKARELGRERVVPGDRVAVVGDLSGAPGSLARIVRVTPRRTVLRRTADDTDGIERVIVANADQLVVVAALAEPEPRPRMIDRCVVAAYDAGMDALLVLTKADIGSADELAALYEPAGVRILVTSKDGDEIRGIDAVREAIDGRVSVLIGHSGVGKSTLVNALVPEAFRAIGHVNVVTGRGRHTSTSAIALPVAGAAATWVIDTPGVRSFGLAHVTMDTLLAAFDDLAEAAEQCPRGCTHAADAPDCAIDEWAGTDPQRLARLDSLRRLMASKSDPDNG